MTAASEAAVRGEERRPAASHTLRRPSGSRAWRRPVTLTTMTVASGTAFEMRRASSRDAPSCGGSITIRKGISHQSARNASIG